jgi:hypothetical protein
MAGRVLSGDSEVGWASGSSPESMELGVGFGRMVGEVAVVAVVGIVVVVVGVVVVVVVEVVALESV